VEGGRDPMHMLLATVGRSLMKSMSLHACIYVFLQNTKRRYTHKSNQPLELIAQYCKERNSTLEFESYLSPFISYSARFMLKHPSIKSLKKYNIHVFFLLPFSFFPFSFFVQLNLTFIKNQAKPFNTKDPSRQMRM